MLAILGHLFDNPDTLSDHDSGIDPVSMADLALDDMERESENEFLTVEEEAFLGFGFLGARHPHG